MHPITKVYIYENDTRFFGEGPYRLLHAVEQTGSLRKAALSMDMAYSKAFQMIKNMEHSLGYAITTKSIGGKGGGGSQLTPEAKEFMKKYERYKNACKQENERLYNEIFKQ